MDRANNIIRGVSLVSLGEARGHKKFADQKTLEQVRDCAKQYKSGLRVRFNPSTFNHGDAALAGFITPESIRITGGKVTGDLHVYSTYPNRDYLYEIAERAPDNVGLSIEFNGTPEEIDGQAFARCDEIFAATLVDLPAANPTGLFAAKDAKKPYGDVEYADPGYQEDGQHRYPIDTEAHCRAAWSYVNQSDNASKYSSDQLSKIKGRIKAAAKKHGIEISEESMSMTDEQVTTLSEKIVAGLKPLFENVFRAPQNTPDDSPPTDEEKEAAGCAVSDTPEQVKTKVQAWRKKADQPLTAKDLMQFFRFTGNRAAKVSAEIPAANGDGAFEQRVVKYRQAGMGEGKAIRRASQDDGKGYNEWVQRGRPTISSK